MPSGRGRRLRSIEGRHDVLDPLLDAGKQFGSTHVVHVGGPERLELPKCRNDQLGLGGAELNGDAIGRGLSHVFEDIPRGVATCFREDAR
jgi:hypothetical protein